MPGIPPHTAFALARGTAAYPQRERVPRVDEARRRPRPPQAYRAPARPRRASAASGGC